MHSLFQNSTSNWIRFDKYHWKQKDKILYITPCEDAELTLYNPLENSDQLVLDAINLGLTCMSDRSTPNIIQDGIMSFITKYGMLGIMTALPTTAEFITYEEVYFPKNPYIKSENLETEAYLSYFFPFEPLAFRKRGRESSWDITDITTIPALMVLRNKPQSVLMSFQKEYAERYDWLVKIFQDWAFTFLTSAIYYQDQDALSPEQKHLYSQGMAAFQGISPTYHIELREHPTLVWDFHSLLLQIQMMFSFMITDEHASIKVCKHCAKAFLANRPNTEFCSPQCKNQYNVYKSRMKTGGNDV